MGRVINTNNPGKVRNFHMRSIAELLRHLMQKPTYDDEAKDMTAFLVYSLREIYDSTSVTIEAWEKRGYWMKAERFMREWRWSIEVAADIEDVLRHDAFDLVPELLVSILPKVSSIEIKRFLRKPVLWHGSFDKLMAEDPRPLPY